MAMSNAERQKRWKAKHRALYNLQRRNKRKNLGAGECVATKPIPKESVAAEEIKQSIPPPQTSKEALLASLRASIAPENLPPATAIPAAPVKLPQRYIFGRPATEEEWQKKLELDRIADEKGYTRDEFSQA